MTIPSVRRGFLYPTMLQSRCPRHHSCLITKKCQNYDRHNSECVMCESRVRPARDLGGLLPEGAYLFDAQATVKKISDQMGCQFGDPNAETRTMEAYSADSDETLRLTETLQKTYGLEPPKLTPYAD